MMTGLLHAIKQARLEDWSENGRCSMCSVGDKPYRGLHRGLHKCGNEEACALCHGCLPPGEICAACYRKNVYDVEC